jgi:hypothetical protein
VQLTESSTAPCLDHVSSPHLMDEKTGSEGQSPVIRHVQPKLTCFQALHPVFCHGTILPGSFLASCALPSPGAQRPTLLPPPPLSPPVLNPRPKAGQGLWFFQRLPRYQSLWFSTRPITCLSGRGGYEGGAEAALGSEREATA